VEIPSVLNLAPLLGMHSGDLWYALPLIVVISLVYQATRHEKMGSILWGAARFGLWLAGFMAAASAILYFISVRL
jgi:hypothetical protein